MRKKLQLLSRKSFINPLILYILSFSFFPIPSAEKGHRSSLASAGWQMDVCRKSFRGFQERHHHFHERQGFREVYSYGEKELTPTLGISCMLIFCIRLFDDLREPRAREFLHLVYRRRSGNLPPGSAIIQQTGPSEAFRVGGDPQRVQHAAEEMRGQALLRPCRAF